MYNDRAFIGYDQWKTQEPPEEPDRDLIIYDTPAVTQMVKRSMCSGCAKIVRRGLTSLPGRPHTDCFYGGFWQEIPDEEVVIHPAVDAKRDIREALHGMKHEYSITINGMEIFRAKLEERFAFNPLLMIEVKSADAAWSEFLTLDEMVQAVLEHSV